MSHLMATAEPNLVGGIAIGVFVVLVFGWMFWKTRSAESRADLREKHGRMGPTPPTRGAGD